MNPGDPRHHPNRRPGTDRHSLTVTRVLARAARVLVLFVLGFSQLGQGQVHPQPQDTTPTVLDPLLAQVAKPHVLGGVVQVGVAPTYVEPHAPGSLRARVGAGTGGSVGADLSAQQGFGVGSGSAQVRAGVGYRQWDYQPIGESIEQPPLAKSGEQINSDLKQWNAFVAGRVQGSRGQWLGLSSVAFGAERGVAPELHVAEPRLWRLPVTRRWVTVLGAGMGWEPGSARSGSLSLRGAIDVGRFEIDEYGSSDDSMPRR